MQSISQISQEMDTLSKNVSEKCSGMTEAFSVFGEGAANVVCTSFETMDAIAEEKLLAVQINTANCAAAIYTIVNDTNLQLQSLCDQLFLKVLQCLNICSPIIKQVLQDASFFLDTMTNVSNIEDVFLGFKNADEIQNKLNNIDLTLTEISEHYDDPSVFDYLGGTSDFLSILATDFSTVKDNLETLRVACYVIADDTLDFLKEKFDAVKKACSDWGREGLDFLKEKFDAVKKACSEWGEKALEELKEKVEEVGTKIKDFGKKIPEVTSNFFKANWQTLLLIGSFALLAAGIVVLVSNWSSMSTLGRTVTILSSLAAAAGAAAIAVALFHSSWSVGVAAAAIAAGAALIIGTISFSEKTTIPSVSVATPDIPKAPELDEFADGGFPSTGQMFIAREAGPELVGTIGSRNAVVNNEQIVESVSRGVYDAVRAALGGGTAHGGTTEVKLYLDGKQITAAVEKVQRERGLSLSNRSLVMA